MRRVSLASSRALLGRVSRVECTRAYSSFSLSGLIEVPEDLPIFQEEYKKLLQKYNVKENSPQAPLLKEISKARVAALEGVREEIPEEFAKYETGIKEIEEVLFNWRPTIRATVDVATDTKNHPFVTDSIGAQIFQAASEVIDKQDYASKLAKERFGLTPRKQAEVLWDLVENSALEEGVATEAPTAAKEDLPGWVVQALEQVNWGKNIKNRKDLFGQIFPDQPISLESPAQRENRVAGREAALKLKVAELASKEGFAPGSDEYVKLEKELKDFDFSLPQGYESFQASVSDTFNRSAELAKSFESQVLNSEVGVESEVTVNAIRYTGENGVARRAISGFLLSNPEPSTDDKVKFMKVLREAVLQRRKALGLVPRELYPTLNLPAERNADDATLVAKFDEYVISL